MPGFIDPQAVLRNPAYIHESAYLYGKVIVEEGASIWVNAVARAEHKEIVIGAYTNIQDFAMLHIGDATPTIIGSHCSITHHCTIHGCTIGDNCLIGINATIMDGCVIGENSIIGGHTFLKEGTVVPPNSIITPIGIGANPAAASCAISSRMALLTAEGFMPSAIEIPPISVLSAAVADQSS